MPSYSCKQHSVWRVAGKQQPDLQGLLAQERVHTAHPVQNSFLLSYISVIVWLITAPEYAFSSCKFLSAICPWGILAH